MYNYLHDKKEDYHKVIKSLHTSNIYTSYTKHKDDQTKAIYSLRCSRISICTCSCT